MKNPSGGQLLCKYSRVLRRQKRSITDPSVQASPGAPSLLYLKKVELLKASRCSIGPREFEYSPIPTNAKSHPREVPRGRNRAAWGPDKVFSPPAPPHGGQEGRRKWIAIWLILPVVIRLSQRLSHACLSINRLYCETAYGSLNQL